MANKKSLLPILLLGFLCVGQPGCVRYYTKYPKDKLEKPPQKRYSQVQYHIKPYSFVLDSGQRGLETALRLNSPFLVAELVESIPKQGLYYDVEVKWRQPGISSFVFLYISYATYFIIPQWSTKEQFKLIFNVYKDGQFKQEYVYEVGRKGFTWLPAIVVTWITGTTPNQAEVFESVVYKFYDDAEPYFTEARAQSAQ